MDNVCDYLCDYRKFNLKEIASDDFLTNRWKKLRRENQSKVVLSETREINEGIRT